VCVCYGWFWGCFCCYWTFGSGVVVWCCSLRWFDFFEILKELGFEVFCCCAAAAVLIENPPLLLICYLIYKQRLGFFKPFGLCSYLGIVIVLWICLWGKWKAWCWLRVPALLLCEKKKIVPVAWKILLQKKGGIWYCLSWLFIIFLKKTFL
jgi:hypothetical protein